MNLESLRGVARKLWAGSGLKTKLVLVALAGQTMAVILSLMATSSSIDAKLEEAAAHAVKNYAFLLNATMNSAATSGNWADISSFMGEIIADEESTLKSVAVYDASGSKLVSLGGAKSLSSFASSPDSALKKKLTERGVSADFPLLLKNGEVGRCVFDLELPEFKDLRLKLMWSQLWAGFSGLLLAAAFLLTLSRGMQNRLDRLDEASRRVSDGELQEPIESMGEDELGRLAESFESMRQNLSVKIDALAVATERARNSERNFKDLFDNAPVALVLARQLGNKSVEMALFNKGFEQLWPMDRENMAPPWLGSETTWRSWEKEGTQLVVEGASGQQVLEARASRTEWAGWPCWTLSFVDETEKTSAISALNDLNASLEDRVKARSRELEASNQDLSAALVQLRRTQEHLVSQEKLAGLGAMVAGMAHEMSTPIGNAVLAGSSLQEQAVKFGQAFEAGSAIKRASLMAHNEKTLEACRIISQNLERASNLIKSFKQIASDRRDAQVKAYSVEQVFADTLSSMEQQFKKSKVPAPEVSIEKGLDCRGYPGSLSQILSQAVGNSLLHAFEGRAGGLVRIRAKTDPSDQAYYLVEFEDDGSGMDDEVRKKIFDPFFTTKMGQGSSGMGMSIVHALVTGLMRGSISVRSSPGHGTKITLRLPKDCS